MKQNPFTETHAPAVGPRGPLAGIRIVDLTSVVFGPYATQTLGDMGADVIKVEGPDGDIVRRIQPERNPGMGAAFLCANRNKRSLVLDLKRPEARAALLKVIAGADVFVHSMRPQAIAKLGLTYADVKAAKPDIVYCSAWGFASDGPYAERPAYDDVIQAMSGVADLTRRQTGGAPALAPTILADKTSGMALTSALLLALFHRERTGEGQQVEVPMFEVMTSNVLIEHLAGSTFVPPIATDGTTMGYSRVLAPDRKPYPTADGFMTVTPYTDKHWQKFFEVAGRPELGRDPRFNAVGARSQNIRDLYAIVAQTMPAKTTAEWLVLLEQADIPAIQVNRLEDLLEDRHLVATGFFQEYDHPSEGRIRTTAVPVRLSASPGDALRLAPPRLGQHTRDVLSEAGLTQTEIGALVQAGAAVADGNTT